MLEEFIWSLKYRPKTVQNTILPETTKKTFQKFVDDKLVPSLLLNGPPGCGKTTIAMAMLDELECDYIIINGSMNGNIDTLRNEILQFASSVSLSGGRKYVIIDEADYLNANSTQPALRNFMETFSKNCGFILTSNYKNRIIKEIHSRCSVIDFKIEKKDLPDLANQFMKRTIEILNLEEIMFDKAVLAEVIKKHMPDWRRVLNELQKYAATGAIDSGILSDFQEVSIRELMSFLKSKDFTSMRKWVAENSDVDITQLYRKIYDNLASYVTKGSIPQAVLVIGKYQYQSSFCADQEINNVCCLTEIMVESEWL
jgi:DNA polymerase III delta prime subunit